MSETNPAGTPFGLTEVRAVLDMPKLHPMNPYHRDLFKWLVRRVEALEAEVTGLRYAVVTAREALEIDE